MLYDRDWGALPAHAQHSKSVRAQVFISDSFCLFSPTFWMSVSGITVHHSDNTAPLHHKLHHQELTSGVPLSVSTAEVISGRVAEVGGAVEAPVGVCPFPHGMATGASSSVPVSVSAASVIDVPVPVPSRAAAARVQVQVEVEASSPSLVQLMDDLDDSSEGAVDYMALADEVERWLAEEERQRNL